MLFNIFYIVIFFLLFPFFLLKSCVSASFRKIFFYRLKASFFIPQVFSSQILRDKNLIWMHAASVGEVDLVRLLQEKWQVPYFITTNTLSGLAQAKKFNPHSFIAPLDFSWAVQNWLTKIKIRGLVLVEAEIWYNTISLAAKKCPVTLINGRVQKKQGFNFRLYQKLLKQFSLILASNQSSYNFYLSLSKNTEKKVDKSKNHKPKIAYSGNLKFASSVATKPTPIQKQKLLKKLLPTKSTTKAKLFLAASLQPEEIPIILEAYFLAQQKISDLYLVLIPRHLEKTALFFKQLPKNTQVISKHPPENISQKILFIPLIGVLKDWYANADSVFVGGSLCARGGQNIIEPLCFGTPTATGWNNQNFEFAMQLFLNSNSICEVHNATQLSNFIVKSIQQPALFKKGLDEAQKIISRQSSALPYSVRELKRLYH